MSPNAYGFPCLGFSFPLPWSSHITHSHTHGCLSLTLPTKSHSVCFVCLRVCVCVCVCLCVCVCVFVFYSDDVARVLQQLIGQSLTLSLTPSLSLRRAHCSI